MVKTVGGEHILCLRLSFALGFNRIQKPTPNCSAMNILNEKKTDYDNNNDIPNIGVGTGGTT